MKNVYDTKEFFDSYQEMRSESVNANNLIENPIIKSMMPNLAGKTILDLGCGDGNMDRFFVENGAKKVLAVDISQNMINEAKKVNGLNNLTYEVMGMEDIAKIKQKFDFVYSSLAFHYVEDFNRLIKDIFNLLKVNGELLFSQENPLLTAIVYNDENQTKHIELNGKRYYLLSDYQNEGKREKIWNNTTVTKYHRTYASIVNSLVKNGFQILEIKDSFASKEAVELKEKYKYEQDRPMFLFVKAKKNNEKC